MVVRITLEMIIFIRYVTVNLREINDKLDIEK